MRHAYAKDTNRKIRKILVHNICGSKNGSNSRTVNTGEVWGEWNQNSNTVIYEKCCSYLSISIILYISLLCYFLTLTISISKKAF